MILSAIAMILKSAIIPFVIGWGVADITSKIFGLGWPTIALGIVITLVLVWVNLNG